MMHGENVAGRFPAEGSVSSQNMEDCGMVQNHFTVTEFVFDPAGSILMIKHRKLMELETYENVRKSVKKTAEHMKTAFTRHSGCSLPCNDFY